MFFYLHSFICRGCSLGATFPIKVLTHGVLCRHRLMLCAATPEATLFAAFSLVAAAHCVSFKHPSVARWIFHAIVGMAHSVCCWLSPDSID